jgi:hypothetical protein
VLNLIRVILRLLLSNRARLVAKNGALHQQLAVSTRRSQRLRIVRRDRIFWVWLSQLWTGWRSALVTVLGHGRRRIVPDHLFLGLDLRNLALEVCPQTHQQV